MNADALSRVSPDQLRAITAFEKVAALRERTGEKAAEMFNAAHEIPTEAQFNDICRKIGLVNGFRDSQDELRAAIAALPPSDRDAAMHVAKRNRLL